VQIIKLCIITLQAALDLYCIITCEGKAVRSFVVNNAQQEASWDLGGIFYRKKHNQPITVEVSNLDSKKWMIVIFSECFIL
jgi:hypothetical protein